MYRFQRHMTRMVASLALMLAVLAGLGTPHAATPARAATPRADQIGIAGNAFPWEDHWAAFQSLLDGSKAGWARVELRWEQIQPNRGAWDWGSTDALVNAYASRDFQELGLLGYSTRWASGGSGSGAVFGPPTDLDAWEGYVQAVVARYRDRIQAWEIWNEPDVAMFWNGRDGGDPAAYLNVLQRAYRAIKSVDPSATVMNGGLTGTERGARFLNTLLDLGGGSYLDAIAFHGYIPSDGLDNDYFRTMVWPLISQARARAGKPLWITEFGWSSGAGGGTVAGSEPAQAVDLARQLPMLFDLGGVARVFIFQFKDPNNLPNSYGITRPDGTAKPAYQAVSTMAAHLAGLSFERRIDLGLDGVWDMRFSSPDRTVDVVWSQRGDRDILVPTGRPSAQLWRMDGSGQAVGASTGGVLIHTGADPVLVERSGQEPPPNGLGRCVYFGQTNRSLCGGFLDFWERNGGIEILGLPISPELTENGRTVQYLERTVLEYHPEWQSTGWGVVGELAGRIVTAGRQNEPAFRPISASSDANCTFFAETGHRLCFGFRSYWQQRGGLVVFGFPISEEFQERNPDTGQTYTVQYFERARFEYHPEYAGTPYAVLLGRLGVQLYQSRYR